MQRDEVVIQDVVNAARLVIEFVKGVDQNTFISDWKTRSAVLYQLTVIGEAVKRLSKEYRAQYPEIPFASSRPPPPPPPERGRSLNTVARKSPHHHRSTSSLPLWGRAGDRRRTDCPLGRVEVSIRKEKQDDLPGPFQRMDCRSGCPTCISKNGTAPDPSGKLKYCIINSMGEKIVGTIVRKCKEALSDYYGARLKGVVLYGSVARGDAVQSSDIDLLVPKGATGRSGCVMEEYESEIKELKRVRGKV